MFGSAVLEVVIGLILVFLLVSLICTAVREIIEAFLKDRAEVLERTMRSLLDDPKGNGKAGEFFNHGLIYPLFRGAYDPNDLRTRTTIPRKPEEAKHSTLLNNDADAPFDAQDLKMKARNGLPSYIPARSVALAILDLSAPGIGSANAPDRLAEIRSSLDSMPPKLAMVMRTALDSAEGDLERVREALEKWYDSAMDRVSGWYKRRSQYIVFPVALGIAVVLNIDAITVASRLSTNDTLRLAVVAEADAYAKEYAKKHDAEGKKPETTTTPDAASPPAPPPPAAPAKSGDSGASQQAATDQKDAGPTYTEAKQNLADAKGELMKLGLPIGWSPPPLGRETCPVKAWFCWSASHFAFVQGEWKQYWGAKENYEKYDALKKEYDTLVKESEAMKLKGQTPTAEVLAKIEKVGLETAKVRARMPEEPVQPVRPVPPSTGPVLTLTDFMGMSGGWLITALAAMLGAPFWFDLLNKFMVIRATVKPHEKSPEEGSEDRRGSRTVVVNNAPPAPSPKPQPEAQPPEPPPQLPVLSRTHPDGFEPHEWDVKVEGDKP